MRRITLTLQATETECGLAALAMLFSASGHHRSIRSLRTQSPVGRDGANLLQLKRLAEEEGFTARALRVGDDMYSALERPFLALWNGAHFVVVEKMSAHRVWVADPAIGRTVYTRDEFAAHADGIVLVIEPTARLVREPRAGLGLIRFFAPFLPRRASGLLALVIASLSLSAAGILGTMLTRWVIDTIVPIGRMDGASIILLVAAAVALPYLGFAALRYETILWLEKYLDASMILRVFQHLLSLPFSYFQHRPAGDLLVRFGSVSFIRDTLSGRLFPIAIDAIFITLYLAVLGTFDVRFVFAVAAVIALYTVALVVVAPAARRLADREIKESADAQGVLLEAITGIETVKSFGGEGPAFRRYAVAFGRQLGWSVRRARLDNATTSFFDVVSFINPIVILSLGAALVLAGDISVGTMVAATALASAAVAPARAVGTNLQAILTVRVHLDRLRDILEEESEDIGQDRPVLDFVGGIEFREVTYRYSAADRATLSEVSLTIEPGSFVAIVGRSGSGKSTLARLCVGLLLPEEGTVLFDGFALEEVNLDSVRKQTGIVTQNNTGIAASIEENVRFGRTDVPLDRVVAAARVAELDDDIRAMGLGYKTPLGEGGAGLSGGQMQRLAIARALVGSPRLVVLDEATSHLDAMTEARVTRNLAELGVTRVVIAHRLSTIVDADKIVFLQEGRVLGHGTHQELQALPEYRALLAAQHIHEREETHA